MEIDIGKLFYQVVLILTLFSGIILLITQNKRGGDEMKKWNVNDLVMEVAKREVGKKEVNIAQIREIVSKTRQIIKERSGTDFYRLLNIDVSK